MNYDLGHLEELEGGNRQEFYEPPTPDSGVSIGLGFDLGQHDPKKLKKHLSQGTYDKVRDFVGLKGQAARSKLEQRRKYGTVPMFTPAEIAEINRVGLGESTRRSSLYLDRYAQTSGGRSGKDISAAERTVLTGIAHHRGNLTEDERTRSLVEAISDNDRPRALKALSALAQDKRFGGRYQKDYDYLKAYYDADREGDVELPPEVREYREARQQWDEQRFQDPEHYPGEPREPQVTGPGPIPYVSIPKLPARSGKELDFNSTGLKALYGLYDLAQVGSRVLNAATAGQTDDPDAELRRQNALRAGAEALGMSPDELALGDPDDGQPEMISPETQRARMEANAALFGIMPAGKTAEELDKELENVDPELASMRRVEGMMKSAFPRDASVVINPTGLEGKPIFRWGDNPDYELGFGDIDLYPVDAVMALVTPAIAMSRFVPAASETMDLYAKRMGPKAFRLAEKELVERYAAFNEARAAGLRSQARMRTLREEYQVTKGKIAAATDATEKQRLTADLMGIDARMASNGELLAQQDNMVAKQLRALRNSEYRYMGKEGAMDLGAGASVAASVNAALGDPDDPSDDIMGPVATTAMIAAAPVFFTAGGALKRKFVRQVAEGSAEKLIEREGRPASKFTADEIRKMGIEVTPDSIRARTVPSTVNPHDPSVKQFRERVMNPVARELRMDEGRQDFLELLPIRPHDAELDFGLIEEDLRGIVSSRFEEGRDAFLTKAQEMLNPGSEEYMRVRGIIDQNALAVTNIRPENLSPRLDEADRIYLQRRNNLWKENAAIDPLSVWSEDARRNLQENNYYVISKDWEGYLNKTAQRAGIPPDERVILDEIDYDKLLAGYRQRYHGEPSAKEFNDLITQALPNGADEAARKYVDYKNYIKKTREVLNEDTPLARAVMVEMSEEFGRVRKLNDGAVLLDPPPTSFGSTGRVIRDAAVLSDQTLADLQAAGQIVMIDPRRMRATADAKIMSAKEAGLPPTVVGLGTNPKTGALEVVANKEALQFAQKNGSDAVYGLVVDGSLRARPGGKDALGVFVKDGERFADEIIGATEGERMNDFDVPERMWLVSTDPAHKQKSGFKVRAHIRPGTAIPALSMSKSADDILHASQAMKAAIYIAQKQAKAAAKSSEAAAKTTSAGWKALRDVMKEERRLGYFKGTSKELDNLYARLQMNESSPFDAYKKYLQQRDFLGGVRNPGIYFDENEAARMRIGDVRTVEVAGDSIPAAALKVHNMNRSPHANEVRVYGDAVGRDVTDEVTRGGSAPFVRSNAPRKTTGGRIVDESVGDHRSVPPFEEQNATNKALEAAPPEMPETDYVEASVRGDIFDDTLPAVSGGGGGDWIPPGNNFPTFGDDFEDIMRNMGGEKATRYVERLTSYLDVKPTPRPANVPEELWNAVQLTNVYNKASRAWNKMFAPPEVDSIAKETARVLREELGKKGVARPLAPSTKLPAVRGQSVSDPGRSLLSPARNPDAELSKMWAERHAKQVSAVRAMFVGKNRQQTLYNRAWKMLSRSFERQASSKVIPGSGGTLYKDEIVDMFDRRDLGLGIYDTSLIPKEQWETFWGWHDHQMGLRRELLESLDPEWARHFRDGYTGVHIWDKKRTYANWKKLAGDPQNGEAWQEMMRQRTGRTDLDPFAELSDQEFAELAGNISSPERRGTSGRSTRSFSGRTWQNFRMMHDLGFVPVTYNPVDLTLHKLSQIDAYVMRARMMQRLEKEGLVVSMTDGQIAKVRSRLQRGGIDVANFPELPPNARALLENMSIAGGNRNVVDVTDLAYGLTDRARKGGAKKYFADDSTRMILRNYLDNQSTYDDQFGTIYKRWRRANLLLTMHQLGMSNFHIQNMGWDTLAYNLQLGTEKASFAAAVKAMDAGKMTPERLQRMVQKYGPDAPQVLKNLMANGVKGGDLVRQAFRHYSRAVPIPMFGSTGAMSAWSANWRRATEKIDEGLTGLMRKASGGKIDWDYVFSEPIRIDVDPAQTRMGLGLELSGIFDGIHNPNLYREDVPWAMEYGVLSNITGHHMPSDYMLTNSASAMRKAWNDVWNDPELGQTMKWLKGSLGAAGAGWMQGFEAASKWIFDSFVPSAKMMAFYDMFRWEVQKAGPDVTQEQLIRIGQDVADRIDDRMGMMAYDNLFLQEKVKKTLFSTLRSPGWQYGTMRVIYGGALDSAKVAGRIGKNVATFKPPLRGAIKPKEAIRIGYLFSIGLATTMGSDMYRYLTGQEEDTSFNPDMSTWENVWDYARKQLNPASGQTYLSGEPERMVWPTYVKEPFSLHANGFQSLAETASHKLSPAFGTLAGLWRGADYNGDLYSSADEEAPWSVLNTLMSAGVDAVMPFSVSQFEDRVRKLDGREKWGRMALEYAFGLTPANVRVRSSSSMLYLRTLGPGAALSTPPTEQERREGFKVITRATVRGELNDEMVTDLTDHLSKAGIDQQAIKEGKMSAMKRGMRHSMGLYVVNEFDSARSRMTSLSQLHEFIRRASPEELFQFQVPDPESGSVGFAMIDETASRLYQKSAVNDPEKAQRLLNEAAKMYLKKVSIAGEGMAHYIGKMMKRNQELKGLQPDEAQAPVAAVQ